MTRDRCDRCETTAAEAQRYAEAHGLPYSMGGGDATGDRWLCVRCIREEDPAADVESLFG